MAEPVQSALPASVVRTLFGLDPVVSQPVAIQVRPGVMAQGWIAMPNDEAPTTLVVLCHALGGNAADLRPFMEDLAEEGAVVVAMDYRGPAGTFNVEAGVEDTVAATELILATYPSIQTRIIYGFSMGGEVSGVTVATMPPDTFDYWIAGAAVVDLERMWNEVEMFRPIIENETGGTPEEAPGEYLRRSPMALVDAIAAANLTGAVIVHARADPIVNFDQATDLQAALSDRGVPVVLVAIGGSSAPWACSRLDPVCTADPWATLDSHMVGHLTTLAPLVSDLLDGEWTPVPATEDVAATERLQIGLADLVP